LAAGPAAASAPPALVASTIKAASLLAAGRAAGGASGKSPPPPRRKGEKNVVCQDKRGGAGGAGGGGPARCGGGVAEEGGGRARKCEGETPGRQEGPEEHGEAARPAKAATRQIRPGTHGRKLVHHERRQYAQGRNVGHLRRLYSHARERLNSHYALLPPP